MRSRVPIQPRIFGGEMIGDRGFFWIFTFMLLIFGGGFFYASFELTKLQQHLRPHIFPDIIEEVNRTKEQRIKQNPITISQYMGKAYNQVTLSEILQKMINEGSDLDLYWAADNLWGCTWTRHEKRFWGRGL